MNMKLITTFIFGVLFTLPLLVFAQGPVDINTADKEILMATISGVGEKKAEAIIKYREKNGAFESIDELSNVRGVSKMMVDKHREMLTVSGSTPKTSETVSE